MAHLDKRCMCLCYWWPDLNPLPDERMLTLTLGELGEREPEREGDLGGEMEQKRVKMTRAVAVKGGTM